MFKKLSNVQLAGILAVLVIVYLIIEFTGGEERSASFRENLVEFDTAKISKIEIGKADRNIELLKESGDWKVVIENGRKVDAQDLNVRTAIENLLSIQPSRLATRDPEKWAEFEVDTAGTRVRVYEGEEEALDLIIGKFGMRGQRSFYTYVRLHDENEVYVSDDFMGITFSTVSSGYRDKRLIRFRKDSLISLNFKYPSDSSFILTKNNGNWSVGEIQADSAATVNYLNSIRSLSGKNFNDEIIAGELPAPTLSVTIDRKGDEKITIDAYSLAKDKWILYSTRNPEAYFSDPEGEIVDKLFIGKSKLLEEST